MEPVIPFDPSAVPAALRALDQWVGWRYEMVEGDWSKVPRDPKNGRRASSADPATWSPFETAATAASWHGYAGVGFVFTDEDPYCGIDLDDCLDAEGVPTAAARQVLEGLNSYTEVSPSGTGVKVFIKGKKPEWAKCQSTAIEGIGKIEIYEAARYFTLTGRRLEGFPAEPQERQEQLDALCSKLWSPPKPHTPPPPPGDEPDDELLDRARSAKNADKFRRLFDDGNIAEYDNDDSRADAALSQMLAFWTRGDADRIDRLFRRSRLYREKWDREDYRRRTIENAIERCGGRFYAGRSGRVLPNGAGRPLQVVLGTDEHRVISQTVEALAADPGLYTRGPTLARVLRTMESAEVSGVRRERGSPVINIVPLPNLRDRITEYADLRNLGDEGELIPAHPPAWLVAGVDARGRWPGLRQLRAVSEIPVLRPDGTVWQTPGYDAATEVLYEPSADAPPIPAGCGRPEAAAACATLREVVGDFRFVGPAHESVWMAGLLTTVARHAFRGPAPLLLFDANVRGAGKGLLADTIGLIVTGSGMPVSTYSHDPEEMRKKITSIALAGDPSVLLDNLAGPFGNDSLDAALTTTRWKDRILGKSQMVDLPLVTTWFATGNNVQVAADTARRVVHCRLDVLVERPELRADFRHPNLRDWVRDNRGPLLSAALTIMAAYCRAGRPHQDLAAFGSYEGWSDTVRSALVWAGMPDPCATREDLIATADTAHEALEQLLDVWTLIPSHHDGVVISEVVAGLYPPRRDDIPMDAAAVRVRAALEALVGAPPGKPPTARQVGNRLRGFRRRVVNGRYLDFDPNEYDRCGAVWRLHEVTPKGAPSDSATPRV